MTLRRKLVLAIGLTAVVTTLATGAVGVGLLRAHIQGQAKGDLIRTARAIGAEADEIRGGGLQLRALRRGLRAQGIELVVVTPSGAVEGELSHLVGRMNPTPLAGGGAVGDIDGYAYVVWPIFGPRGSPRGIAGPQSRIVLFRKVALGRATSETALRVGLAGLVAALIGLLVARILAKRIAAPLGPLTTAAGDIARGDLTARVVAHSTDEFGALGVAFNDMATSLEEARRREREFLENVSHELRTPVTAIRGYTEAIEDEASPPAPALAIIREEAGRLERMIGDVMNLARLGAGEYALALVATDAAEVARAALAAAAVTPADGVTTAVAATSPVPLRTDPDRLRQVLVNLIENAVRVTTAGSVEIRVGPGTDGGAFIEVVDTGPGIAPTDLPHVFERQYLWHASRADRPVGTGLGLAVVRGLVDALGGTIEVASSPGGTTFRLKIPNRAD